MINNLPPTIKEYSIQFCGMFNFSSKQRRQLQKRPFYKKFELSAPKIRGIIAKQYYPVFRPFILNNSSDSEYLELVSASPVSFANCLFANYTKHGQPEPSPYFNIQNVSLTFYDEKFRIGIYSFEAVLLDGQKNASPVDLNDYTAFVKFCREFENEIILGNETLSISSFVEKKLLCLDDKGSCIKVSEHPDSPYYSGSKLKTWMTADILAYSPGYDQEKALYEIGTSGSFMSSCNGDVYQPSDVYLKSVMEDQISVFNNWTALCLFDSFTLIGNDYLKHGETVWRETYLKIYKFNLYYKFYLFKVNSDLATKGKLSITRNELSKFINKYNLELISYNFLPNLIFSNIKKALGTQSETSALMDKIENTNRIFKEESDKHLNILLSIIAVLSLVSVIGDFSDLVAKLYGVQEPSQGDIKINTWIALSSLVIIIIILATRYLYKLIKK